MMMGCVTLRASPAWPKMITSRKVTVLTALTPRSEENARKTRLAHKAATFREVVILGSVRRLKRRTLPARRIRLVPHRTTSDARHFLTISNSIHQSNSVKLGSGDFA